jgi:hypothetical protein
MAARRGTTVVFWSSLTVVDALVAGLLLVRPRAGVLCLILLMLSDVAHNTWFVWVHGGAGWMVLDQWVFLIFVLVTARMVGEGIAGGAAGKKGSEPNR